MSADDDSASEDARVVIEERGPLAIVRFARPHERNPLSLATLEELERVIPLLSTRRDLTAFIFTGSDDVFASGANIREIERLTPESALRFSLRGQALFRSISQARQLTVAAVNGYCMGGGLDLALACDVRLASSAATFAHPGARLGIITGWGGTRRLPAIVGAAHAAEMFLTARHVSGVEALEMGLVSRLCNPVLECAVEMAERLTKKSAGD